MEKKTKGNKKPISKNKLEEGFKSAGYSVKQYYIDNIKNSVPFIQVQNDINRIQFLCKIPSYVYLYSEEGIYILEDENVSPDSFDAMKLWNECSVKNICIHIFQKIIVEGTVYSCFDERPEIDQISILERCANEMSVVHEDLNDKNISNGLSHVEFENINSFDVLMDGGSFNKTKPILVEDALPSILVKFNGYCMGQAFPTIEFSKFFEEKDISRNIEWLTNDTKEIHHFQNNYIFKTFDDSINILEKFKQDIIKSKQNYEESIQTSKSSFLIIKDILSKPNLPISYMKDAYSNLGLLLFEGIERRDKILLLLESIKNSFHEI